jgi:hypothetical protein
MVTPSPGAIEFLRSRPERDGRLAARRMEPPSDAAAAIMANGGLEPGVLAVAEPVVAPTETATTTTTAALPTDEAATPVTTASEPVVADPVTGATAAPTE